MSSPDIDVSQLSDSERTALETYTAVTSQDVSEAIPLLRRSQWNVQVSGNPKQKPPMDKANVLIQGCEDCGFQVL